MHTRNSSHYASVIIRAHVVFPTCYITDINLVVKRDVSDITRCIAVEVNDGIVGDNLLTIDDRTL